MKLKGNHFSFVAPVNLNGKHISPHQTCVSSFESSALENNDLRFCSEKFYCHTSISLFFSLFDYPPPPPITPKIPEQFRI